MRRLLGSRRACAAFFLGAGVLHFVRPQSYERIVPPGFGDPATAVAISGVAEIVGALSLGGGLLRRPTRWWLVGLLAGIFPANVYMAFEPEQTGAGWVPRGLLWARLPLQAVLIWWVIRVTRDDQ